MQEKLQELLCYSFNNVEFYNELYSQKGFDANSLSQIDFKDIPIINKRMVVENQEKIISQQYNITDLQVDQTSGTTGLILNVYWSKNDFICSNKYLWSARKKYYSIGPFNKVVKFHTGAKYFDGKSYNPPRIIQNDRKLSLCKLFLDETQLKEYIYCINEFGPEWINSSPAIMNLFYIYMANNSISFNKTIKYIEVSGEHLSPFYRERMDLFFGINMINQYGSRETNAIAIECKNKYLHCLSNNFIEVVNENFEVLDYNQEGYAIVSNLYNKAMPLIRYNLGDKIVLINGKTCTCGNEAPIIKLTACRISDYILTEDGRKIYCIIFINIIGMINYLNNNSIRQYKVVQNNYNQFTVNLSIKPNYNHNRIISSFKKIAEEQLNINATWTFIFYDYIFPDNLTGKLKFFENKMLTVS